MSGRDGMVEHCLESNFWRHSLVFISIKIKLRETHAQTHKISYYLLS